MKRLILTAALILGIGTAAHAQFTAGTKYISTSVTGLSMNYSKNSDLKFGLNADGGYYFADGWMVKGNFNYNHAKNLDGLAIGAGVRYSFLQNGIFIGAGLEYAFDKFTNTNDVLGEFTFTETTLVPRFDENGALVYENGQIVYDPETHVTTDEHLTTVTTHERVNNIRIPIEIGYTFYLNHYLAIEPAIYSKMSLNNFSDGTEFGLKIGFGFFFDRFHNVKKHSRWDF